MARRGVKPLEIGGEWRSGNPAQIPPGHVLNAKNMYQRPGRLEMRPPWVRETDAVVATPQAFVQFYGAAGNDLLTVSDTAGVAGVYVKNGGATWAVVGGSGNGTAGDYANIFDKVYASYKDGTEYKMFSYDGAIYSATPCQTGLAGATVTQFINRLFTGNVTETTTNLLTPAKAYNVTTWTASAGCLTAYSSAATEWSSVQNKVAGSGEGIHVDTGVTPAAKTYVRWLIATSAESSRAFVPLTATIEDTAGQVYATHEFNAPVLDYFEFSYTSVEVEFPAAKQIRLRLVFGNSGAAALLNEVFYFSEHSTSLAYSDDNYGQQLTYGRYNFPFIGYGWDKVAPAWSGSHTNTFPDRVMWCEALDATYWRAINYYDCKDIPGAITAIRPGPGRLFAFKRRGVWRFRPGPSADNPIQYEHHYAEFGTVSPKSIDTFENRLYFIDPENSEVFAWDGSEAPEPLAGDGMREWLFNPATLVTTPVLRVDAKNGEVYCIIRSGVIAIYNLRTKNWTHLTCTTSAGADLTITDLAFQENRWLPQRRMYALVPSLNRVVKLLDTSTQDNTDGVAAYVNAVVEFRPLESAPRNETTLETLALRHKITGDQTNATLTAEVSLDEGVTFTKTNQVRVAPVSVGGVKRTPIPLDQTAPLIHYRLSYTGPAGDEYFNVYGGDLELNVRGKETPNETPTNVVASL